MPELTRAPRRVPGGRHCPNAPISAPARPWRCRRTACGGWRAGTVRRAASRAGARVGGEGAVEHVVAQDPRVEPISRGWLRGQVANPSVVAVSSTALSASPARSRESVSSEAVPSTASTAPSCRPGGTGRCRPRGSRERGDAGGSSRAAGSRRVRRRRRLGGRSTSRARCRIPERPSAGRRPRGSPPAVRPAALRRRPSGGFAPCPTAADSSWRCESSGICQSLKGRRSVPPAGDGGGELEVGLGGRAGLQLEGGQPVGFTGVRDAVDDRPDARGGEGDAEVVEGGAAAHGQVPAVGVGGGQPTGQVGVEVYDARGRASSATAGCCAPTVRVTRARWRCARFAGRPGR